MDGTCTQDGNGQILKRMVYGVLAIHSADCGYEDVIVCKRVGIKSQKKEDKQESNTENRRLQADIVTKLTDVNILRKSKDLVLKKKKKK